MSVYNNNLHLNKIEECLPMSPPRTVSVISRQSRFSHDTLPYNSLSPISNQHFSRHQSEDNFYSFCIKDKLALEKSFNSQLTDPVNIQEASSSFQVKDIIKICPPKDNTRTFNTEWLNTNMNKDNNIHDPQMQTIHQVSMESTQLEGICHPNNSNGIIMNTKNNSSFLQDFAIKRQDNYSILQESHLSALAKKKEIEIEFELSQEIMKFRIDRLAHMFKNNTLFNVLQYFNGDDMGNIMNTSRQIRKWVEFEIEATYYQNIIQNIKKNNSYFELLLTKVHYSKLRKKSVKIDIVTTIRFKNIFKLQNAFQNKATNLGISFIYKNLSTQDERYIDYYSCDIVSKDGVVPVIFMTREFTTFNLDHLQKTYIQPILPFKEDDQAILNIKLFSPETGFINPSDFLFKFKLTPINNDDQSNDNNPRICEYEDVCFHWKILSYLPQQSAVLDQLKNIFEPLFKIVRVQYEDIGYLIIKVTLKAIKVGIIQNKEELGISLKIKEKKDTIINEIKKNDLLFERRNEFELRMDDVITFYLTNNNYNKTASI